MGRMRISTWVLALATVGAIVPCSAHAQITFERIYGGPGDDPGRSVQQTEDGGYIIAGTAAYFGPNTGDVYLIKTDAWGDTLWTRTYGGSDSDYAHSVQQTEDGGYIIAGQTGSFGPGWSNFYLIKTDSLGDTLWTRVYGGSHGGDNGQSVQQTSDGGYIVTGYLYYTGVVGVWLLKTDASGDTVWTRRFRHQHSAFGFAVQQTQDGGYIVAGEARIPGYDWNWDVYLIKTDPWGDTLWTRTYGDTFPDRAASVQQTQDGGFIVAGTYGWGSGDHDVLLMKTNAWGDSLWAKVYGSPSPNYGWSVQQTQDSGYIIAGAWASDVCLIKTDSSGDILWMRTYGGTAEDYGMSVQQTWDGGYIIAGSTRSYGAGERDVYLIKTDSLGNVGAEGLVTGGGWIPGGPRGPGSKRTFGFNVHSEVGAVWGQLQFNDHGTKMRVHSDTVKTLNIYGDTIANFSGDCRVDGVSGYRFECEVMDRGEPGHGVDRFSIEISDAAGDPDYSARGLLGGGNIQIHTPTDSHLADGGTEPEVEPKGVLSSLASAGARAQAANPGAGLLHSSPNPFTRSTLITYRLPPRRGDARTREDLSTYERINLSVYDLSGRLVRVLVDEALPTSYSLLPTSVVWDRRDEAGRRVAGGVYFYRLEVCPERSRGAGNLFATTKKMTLLK